MPPNTSPPILLSLSIWHLRASHEKGLLHPPPPPPCGIPLTGPTSQGCLRQQSQGSSWLGATILVTVLVFGGWDRHRDVKPPSVAGIGIFWCHVSPDSREFSTCGATSHLEHGRSSWHDIVLCMTVFVFVVAGCKTWFAPEQNPLPKPQWGRRRRSTERRLYHSDRGTVGNGKQGKPLPPV